MLVSLMARLSAISQMHNAQWAMMQNSRNMMNVARNLPFGGYNMSIRRSIELREHSGRDYTVIEFLTGDHHGKH